MIKWCPNCKNELKQSGGVKHCLNCGGKYYILETQDPKPAIVVEETICGTDVKGFDGKGCWRCDQKDKCIENLKERNLIN